MVWYQTASESYHNKEGMGVPILSTYVEFLEYEKVAISIAYFINYIIYL